MKRRTPSLPPVQNSSLSALTVGRTRAGVADWVTAESYVTARRPKPVTDRPDGVDPALPRRIAPRATHHLLKRVAATDAASPDGQAPASTRRTRLCPRPCLSKRIDNRCCDVARGAPKSRPATVLLHTEAILGNGLLTQGKSTSLT